MMKMEKAAAEVFWLRCQSSGQKRAHMGACVLLYQEERLLWV